MPSATIPQKIEALNQANTVSRTHDGHTRPIVHRDNMIKAIQNIIRIASPTPLGQRATLNFSDDTFYEYVDAVINFTLNGSASASVSESTGGLVASESNANINISDVRDIQLDFDGRFSSGFSQADSGGIDIWVNGVKRINFSHSIQNPDGSGTPFHFIKHSYMLNRNWLKRGNNEIIIKPRYSDSVSSSVSKIRMEYNLPVSMNIGDKNTKFYGHRVGTKRHLTGLRVEFPSNKYDIEFSARGFDIDSPTEIAVFLNQKRIGYLKQGLSSQFNTGDTFILKKEDFVTRGINTIEFVQTSTSDNEIWGVTNMELIGVKPPVITGSLFLLLGAD